ncbi:hypothetical protein GGF42_004301 [Coemansia sp. RSA 2424]|nr:hypothetical protein GGF42_004301 [Coemansia sp. RSA 2424]
MIYTRAVALISIAVACAAANAGIELGDLPRDEAAASSSRSAQFTGMMPDELSSWMDEQSLSAEAAATRSKPVAGASEEQESMEALRTADFISDIVAALWHHHPAK